MIVTGAEVDCRAFLSTWDRGNTFKAAVIRAIATALQRLKTTPTSANENATILPWRRVRASGTSTGLGQITALKARARQDRGVEARQFDPRDLVAGDRSTFCMGIGECVRARLLETQASL